MLILPSGHAEAIRQRRPFRAREKAMVGGVLATVAALVIVLIVALGTSDRQSGHGCISVGLAYSTGGAQIYRCGPGARAMCATVGRAGGPVGATARALTTECRKAGLQLG
jgi:hypothetical protein